VTIPFLELFRFPIYCIVVDAVSTSPLKGEAISGSVGYNSVGIQVRDAYIICFVSLAIFPSKEPYYVFFILPGVFSSR